jgi:hypothetical protein
MATGVLLLAMADVAYAQHEHHAAPEQAASTWTFMQDGVVYGLYNHQGGPRGGDEARLPNWWMGMWSRKAGKSSVTLSSMLSLDPGTVGKRGYREIFQVGEAVDGRPLIDHQHPHDLFMQLAGTWRIPLNERTGFTLAGGLAGEPALGPVAFMHRASAAENPFAPLSHHTFDSTHIAFGVVTAAVDRGPWVVEGSVFNGREPDEHRWDFDFGRMDSVSGRVWYKPDDRWEFQVSTGHLVDPEELSKGNLERTTASASWLRHTADDDFLAVTSGYGQNRAHGTTRHAVFGEATRRLRRNTIYGRAEVLQVETDLLIHDEIPGSHAETSLKDAVGAFTFGGVRDVGAWRGFEGGVGAALTVYAVPDTLKATHGDHPVSFQIFFRLRPPTFGMGRMFNMRMSQPMAGHRMSMDHEME